MTHTYNITGMTCTGCQAKVQSLLSNIPHITKVDIDLTNNKADVTMDEHVPTANLQAALANYPKYSLSEDHHQPVQQVFTDEAEDNRSFFETYKPVLLIFGYVAVVAILIASSSGSVDWMLAMRAFYGRFLFGILLL
jgi:copper chaperone CopZ